MINNNVCPIGNTLDLFNRKWIFCIMSNIFRGMTHFNEFKQANPTISNHVLAQTLKYMEEQDLITKTVVDELHNRTEYALTPKGLRANKILYEITEYYFEELNYTNYDDMEVEELLVEYREIYDVR
ncbi:winged helix-turn-helix transcriptional regulator [Methanobrevibacter sp.]|uniref:winged helix-turn-helix transcriptional regulator n=1 Tax=Methanobrevibacter sp. TaxID=66852 RepID=UPI00388E2DB5